MKFDAHAAMATLFCWLAGAAPSALAWGATGHSVVAEIAWRQLGTQTRRDIAALLGPGISLASVSMWADTDAALNVRTRRWHFVNIPLGSVGYDSARDCQSVDGGPGCVVDAIARQRELLADRTATMTDRARALKYLVHLVADAHQPLHCAERNGDQGGGLLSVSFFGQPTTLHRVWDYEALDKASYDWGWHIDHALAALTPEHAAKAAGDDVKQWVAQSHALAAALAYRVPDDLNLDAVYQEAALSAIHRQLALAGARLARMLRETMGRASMPDRPGRR